MNCAFVIVMMTLLVLPGFASAPTDDMPLWKRLIAIVAPGPGYTARVMRMYEPAVRDEVIAAAPVAPPVATTSTFTAAVSEMRVTEAVVTAPAAEATSSIAKTAAANTVAPANATASASAVTSTSAVTVANATALASQSEQPAETTPATVIVIAKATTPNTAAKAAEPRAEASVIAKAFETIATQSAAAPAEAPRAMAPPAQPPSTSAQPSKAKRSSKAAKREAPPAEPASPGVYQVASVTPAGAAAAVKAARPDAVPADDESATEFQGDPDALPPVPRPAPLKGSCNGGRRIISAFYWEGTHTASGQRFDPNGMTAAHRTLPFGTQLTVGNPRTGKTVIVTINDRGPYTSGVSLDLSRGAAKAIGLQGTGAVCIL